MYGLCWGWQAVLKVELKLNIVDRHWRINGAQPSPQLKLV